MKSIILFLFLCFSFCFSQEPRSRPYFTYKIPANSSYNQSMLTIGSIYELKDELDQKIKEIGLDKTSEDSISQILDSLNKNPKVTKAFIENDSIKIIHKDGAILNLVIP